MADDPLFTLKQLAEQLGLPESTVRYYRDAFLDHIPSVGIGRRRRYPAHAIAVLRTIAKHYASGRPRAEILAAIEGDGGHVQMPTAHAETHGLDEVSNLDLLAAILDGEREQRDALWQMAKEIVRLTDVLEGQDKVLGQIADRAGVAIAGPAPVPRLTAPVHAARPAPVVMEAPPPPPPPPAWPPQPTHPTEPSEPLHAPTTPRIVPGDDIERLRLELEAERQLVERLRTSRLQLEHRVADAEASLEERREKRPSVLRRLLGSDDAP